MVRALGIVACCAIAALAYRARDEPDPTRAAARAFGASLSTEQRAKAVFGLDDAERRDWHFVPRTRNGIALGELAPSQRELARALLAASLGADGLRRVDGIVVLEGVLREMESSPDRDPERYFVSLFGDVEGAGPFGWRFEGHHVALNFSSLGSDAGLAVTPHFLGANPARVHGGEHDGLRVLAAEEDLGRALVASLDASQRAVAIVPGGAPADIYLAPGRDGLPDAHEGIALGELGTEQRQRFWALVEVYVERFRSEQAELERARLRALDPAALRFVWRGSAEPGQPHYYRVQGPRFAIEYDDVQNGANHVHTVWRDLDRDFGDPLREHHQRAHRR